MKTPELWQNSTKKVLDLLYPREVIKSVDRESLLLKTLFVKNFVTEVAQSLDSILYQPRFRGVKIFYNMHDLIYYTLYQKYELTAEDYDQARNILKESITAQAVLKFNLNKDGGNMDRILPGLERPDDVRNFLVYFYFIVTQCILLNVYYTV